MDCFETPRLRAARLRFSDLPEYLHLFGDPQVVKTLLGDSLAPGEAEVAKWLRLSVEHWERNGFGYWLFRDRTDSRFVGRAGLKQSEVNGRGEVGYTLSSNRGSRRIMEKVGLVLEKELVLDGQLHAVYRMSSE